MPRRPPTATLFPYTTLFRSKPSKRDLPHPPAPRLERERAPEVPHQGRPDEEAEDLVVARIHEADDPRQARSEEHTSELQSRRDLVCRLLLEKKKTVINTTRE